MKKKKKRNNIHYSVIIVVGALLLFVLMIGRVTQLALSEEIDGIRFVISFNKIDFFSSNEVMNEF